MKLNLKKCVFGVKGRKCLRFLVDERGIEASPDKINAVLNMFSQQDCLVADKSLLFFSALKRKEFEWDGKAEQAFESLNSTCQHCINSFKFCISYNIFPASSDMSRMAQTKEFLKSKKEHV